MRMDLPAPTCLFDLVNSVVEPIARRGWLAPAPLGVGIVRIDTVGRRTGAPRSRPVLAARAGDRLLVGTVRPRSDWIANLAEDDDATVTTRGGGRTARTEVHRTPVASFALVHLEEPVASP